MTVTRKKLSEPPQYQKATVKAGVLEGATYPEDMLTNAKNGKQYADRRAGYAVATVAAWLEYGSGRNPPRPFLQQTVAREKAAWAQAFVILIKNGKALRDVLKTVGQVMKEDIQQTIDDWPADNAKSWEVIKGFNHGLVQTKHLLKSIESEIDEG